MKVLSQRVTLHSKQYAVHMCCSCASLLLAGFLYLYLFAAYANASAARQRVGCCFKGVCNLIEHKHNHSPQFLRLMMLLTAYLTDCD